MDSVLPTPGTLITHHACNRLRSRFIFRNTPVIVAIAGDSGSGKTTYSDGIRRILGPSMVTTIEMDGYHSENRSQRAISGHLPLDPTYNRLDLLSIHLAKLKQGESISIPTYNHKTGDFGPDKHVEPTPVVLLEGLHALYDQLLPSIDFSIFVDPDRLVKFQWKYKRDIETRKHASDTLRKEMLEREMLYKRHIDYQKTIANVVIKIHPSKLESFARYEYLGPELTDAYNIELISAIASTPLPNISLPMNLSSIIGQSQESFLLSVVPSRYWGKKCNTVTLDGYFPKNAIDALLAHISECTGIFPEDILAIKQNETGNIPSIQFAQLLVAWRFLEEAYLLSPQHD